MPLPSHPPPKKGAEHLRIDFVLGRKALICTPNFPMPRTSKVQINSSTMTRSAKQELETVPSVSSLWLLMATRERTISRMEVLLKIARMEIPSKTKIRIVKNTELQIRGINCESPGGNVFVSVPFYHITCNLATIPNKLIQLTRYFRVFFKK